MKMSGSTRNPRLRSYVGLALTLPASLALQGAGVWLALHAASGIGTAAASPIALALIGIGALTYLVGAGLLIASALGEHGRALMPVGERTGRALATREPASRQKADALAHAQKMEALGFLAGGVAHDFNNLLHVIRNSLEILQRQGAPVDTSRHLDTIRRSADRAAALTRQLLAFSRRQPLDPRPLDPNDLVAQATELLRHSLGERITIHTVLDRAVWSVAADAGQLETALLNLAINARDAMSQVGLLTIETANATLGESVSPSPGGAGSARPYVMIAVSDTGAGMAPEVAARACEPFFTTKDPGHGTGLGLSQVAGFAEQSGGHIRISSAPGRGTTVRLYLPKAGPFPLAPLLAKAALTGPGAAAAQVPKRKRAPSKWRVRSKWSHKDRSARRRREPGEMRAGLLTGGPAP
jgi:signal transduction histidine kinase